MRPLFQSLVFAAALSVTGFVSAAQPAFVGKYVTTPQDIAAINQVVADFQTAIKTKNVLLLSSLVMSSDILFASPARPESVARVRGKYDVNFNGLNTHGYAGFAESIVTEKAAMEERFYNVRITQDDNIAIVMFDFDFVEANKVINHGLETWQMMKNADGKWKIASVFWSSKGEPK